MKKKFLYDGSIESGYYDKIFNRKKGIQSAWHNIKFNYFKNKIHTKKTHLDIGCGPGTFLNLLDKKSIGIDISKDQIQYAQKKFKNSKIKFFKFKKKIPLKSNSIDTITMIELIEHLNNKDLKFLIKECRRVLKKNGTIFLSTPNYFSLWPLLEYLVNFFSPLSYEHQHINKFNKKKLITFFIKNKFKINHFETFIFISPFLAFFSFRASIFISNYERLLKIFFPGFLMYLEVKKN